PAAPRAGRVELPDRVPDAPLHDSVARDGLRDAGHGAGAAALLLLAPQRRLLRGLLLRLARAAGAVRRAPSPGREPGPAPPPRRARGALPAHARARHLCPLRHRRDVRVHGAHAGRGPGPADRGVHEHRLTRSVADYLAKTPKRLAAERAHAQGPDYGREATRAEALDATTCRAFYHMLYLGEACRLAEMVGERGLAGELRARLAAIAGEVERESALRVLPLRPLVAVQAGAGLLALAAPS